MALVGQVLLLVDNNDTPCSDALHADFSTPGHHTLVLGFCLVPTTPRCLSCASDRTLGCNLLGMTIPVPLLQTDNRC